MANTIALFPASTVPNKTLMRKQVLQTAKANAMMSGYYSYYQKGIHNPNKAHAHQALRLATNIMLRRSYDDLEFTNTDPVEVGNPNDNLHAAYCSSAAGPYSSAGCQVIVGQPKCQGRNNQPNTLYWKKFYDIIYQTSQQKFDYALFRFADAAAVASQGTAPMQARLRFGSQGNVVLDLQSKLEALGHFYTNKDGDFGRNTLKAVLEYQTKQFGADEADGVVGNNTAATLGLSLPLI
jgi:hypothetical protein